MFLFGPPNVEKMKARRNVNGLIKALGYKKDWEVRWDAARALGEIKDPRAVEPLSAALKDERFSVRQAAAEALGKIGNARAVEPLIAALGDERSDMRQAAAKALGAIGDARAMEPLIAALKDKDSAVRKAAAEALDHLGWKPAQDESAGWYWMAKHDWDKCVALGALAMEPLIAALKDENEYVREAAARTLGEIKDPRAVQPLIDALQDKKWFVRRTAAEALISIYRRGGLEDKTKTKILALRDKIAAMHTDDHTDKGADCDNHTDIRVRGIEFLL